MLLTVLLTVLPAVLLVTVDGMVMAGAASAAGGRTYYLSPRGDDDGAGTRGAPWRTFGRAFEALGPGDTLLLLDGTYTEATTGVIQPNVRNGTRGKPITIRARHDGKAIIDGQGRVTPVKLGDNWGDGGPYGDWYVVQGIVARNGPDTVVSVKGSHNVLRRVSAYDGDTDDNTLVMLVMGNDNLLEDVVAAGTGRYMINIYGGGGTPGAHGEGNTVRRAFTLWGSWEGRHFCGVTWPNGNHIGVYNASHNTVENAIAYGRALTGIFIQANADDAQAVNNRILGSMALGIGRDYDGSVWGYGQPPGVRPGPTADRWTGQACDDATTQWADGNQRTGFSLWGQGLLRDNVFRDVLAADNVGVGLSVAHPYGPGAAGTVVDHATLYGNGAYLLDWEKAYGGQIMLDGSEVTITNSRIADSEWAAQGEGARLTHRYVDGELTRTPLLPWPMEGRIRAEVGVSVGEIVRRYNAAGGEGD
jgi:hypothetical protein